MIGVHGASGGYRVAIAELPLSTRDAVDPQGAIVVVDGAHGWAARAVSAVEAGAAALVIADPVDAVEHDLAALATAAGAVPVVVDRPRIRPDVAGDAAARPDVRFLTADAVAAAAELGAAVRDAIGWLRILAGGALVLCAAEASSYGAIALLETESAGVPAPMTASVLAHRGGTRVRAQAVGEARVDVDIDAAVDARSVDVSTTDGTRRAPRRYETHERLALRRAADAVAHGSAVSDLGSLRHDSNLAARVFPPLFG